MGWRVRLTVLSRRDVPERMDAPGANPERVRESLRDLRLVNRFLGGVGAVAWGFRRLLVQGGVEGSLRLLDVGTGGGDLPAALARWASGRGWAVRGVGLDRGRTAITLAKETFSGDGAFLLVRGDALALPFRAGAFDVAISSTTLHHFSDRGAIRMLRELRRVARRGVVIGDLRRSLPGYLGARLLAATLWRRHAYARHDGPASVRRAYTVREVQALLVAAGLGGTVRRRPFFRLAAWIPVGDGDG